MPREHPLWYKLYYLPPYFELARILGYDGLPAPEAVQRAKSAAGKRPWFDRIGQDRIYIRHAYREARPTIQPDRYVHDYRGQPIRRFYFDLS